MCAYVCMHVYVYVYVYECVYMYFLVLSAEKAKKLNAPVAESTSSAQILVFSIIHHQREPGLLRETADSRVGTG